MENYRQLYKKSIDDPEQFWTNIKKELFWKYLPKGSVFLNYNFDIAQGPIHLNWMEGHVTNVCYNLLDRIIEKGLGNRLAYHWEGKDSDIRREITYNELRTSVCRFANVLKQLNVRIGDRIAIYMSVTIDTIVAMLACIRIGAIHTVVFSGFSAEALADRLIDSNCIILITSEGTYRAKKFTPLKDISDSALDICNQKGHKIKACIVNRHLTKNLADNSSNGNYSLINWNRDEYYCLTDNVEFIDNICEPVWVDSVHPLLIMYTSGSTGKPKGILHTTGSYMLYSYTVFKYIFDYRDGDVIFSTADLGWIAGHTYSVYGPLANGATTVLYEGQILYPDPGRIWRIVERLKVNIFFTAPTAIRSLRQFGDQYVIQYNRESLRVLGVGGEGISEDSLHWYHTVVGNSRCLISDSYGQTETGGPILGSIFGHATYKYGCSSQYLPFFGVDPIIVDENGQEIDGVTTGQLVYKKPFPGIAQTIIGRHEEFERIYFSKFNGYYWSGDNVSRNSDGFYRISGRIDDTLNVSGHLLSILEVEWAIEEHMAVAEAAVVSAPHTIKGQCICVFVVLVDNIVLNDDLILSIKERVRSKIGALAVPDHIYSLSALPKNNSGKKMRRILNKFIRKEFEELGDISTLADRTSINEIVEQID